MNIQAQLFFNYLNYLLLQVKKSEKGYKRKQEWPLSALKEANYKAKVCLIMYNSLIYFRSHKELCFLFRNPRSLIYILRRLINGLRTSCRKRIHYSPCYSRFVIIVILLILFLLLCWTLKQMTTILNRYAPDGTNHPSFWTTKKKRRRRTAILTA